MSHDFTVGDAARLIGVEPSRIRNWQQHRHIEFGTKGVTGRYRFSLRDVRCIAVTAHLVDHGLEPSHAARLACTVVDRLGDWNKAPLIAVFSRDKKQSACLIPEDALPVSDALIVLPLGPLFGEIDRKAA